MTVPVLLPTNPDTKQQVLLASITINELLKGRMNNTGTVTLTAGATSTAVADNQFQSGQVPLLIPTTANAAGALATTYLTARNNGTFTLTHANAVSTDRTFLYVRIG